MVRGTTVYFKFILPCKYSELASARIVFWQDHYFGPAQNRRLPIIKSLAHCLDTENSNELAVVLMPEETARFTEKRKAYVQLSGTTVEGSRFSHKKIIFEVDPAYDDSIFDPMLTSDSD